MQSIQRWEPHARILLLCEFGGAGVDPKRLGLTVLASLLVKKLDIPANQIFDIDALSKDTDAISHAKSVYESRNRKKHGGVHVMLINTSPGSKSAQGLDLHTVTHIFVVDSPRATQAQLTSNASKESASKSLAASAGIKKMEHLQLQGICRAFRMNPRGDWISDAPGASAQKRSKRDTNDRFPGIFFVQECA